MSACEKILDPVKETLPRSQAKNLRSEIRKAVAENIGNDLEMCQRLFYTRVAFIEDGRTTIPFFAYCGYDSWEEYVTQDLGILYKRARKWSDVYSKYYIELASVFDPKKHSIDINKMILLMKHVSVDNLDAMISAAKNATKEEIKAVLSGPKKTKKKKKQNRLSFDVSHREAGIIHEAISMAKDEYGDDLTDSQILVCILKDYTSQHMVDD